MILFVFTTLFFSLGSFAGTDFTAKFGLDVRVDGISKNNKVDKEGVDGISSSRTDKFQFPSRRLNLTGKILDKTKYRVRLDLGSQFDSGSADSITDAINYFYFDHQFSELFSVRVGKQFIMSSGWEFNYHGSKIYHVGQTHLKLPGYFETGATFRFHLGGQTIGLQATNGLPEDNAQKSESLTQAIFWIGRLLDGKIQPIASIVRYPIVLASAADEKGTVNHSVLGVKFVFGHFDFDVSYGTVDSPTRKVTSTSGTSTTAGEAWNGLVVNAHYFMPDLNIQPFLKYTADNGKVEGKDRQTSSAVSLGIEYYPYANDRSQWFHLTVTGSNDKYKPVQTTNSSLSENSASAQQVAIGLGLII